MQYIIICIKLRNRLSIIIWFFSQSMLHSAYLSHHSCKLIIISISSLQSLFFFLYICNNSSIYSSFFWPTMFHLRLKGPLQVSSTNSYWLFDIYPRNFQTFQKPKWRKLRMDFNVKQPINLRASWHSEKFVRSIWI